MNFQANLVSIHSEEEHQFVVGLHGGAGSPWLGGRRDPGNHSNFLWSDGTPWDYSNWEEGQPSNIPGRSEDCVHLWNINHRHQWDDQPCYVVVSFVCKKKI